MSHITWHRHKNLIGQLPTGVQPIPTVEKLAQTTYKGPASHSDMIQAQTRQPDWSKVRDLFVTPSHTCHSKVISSFEPSNQSNVSHLNCLLDLFEAIWTLFCQQSRHPSFFSRLVTITTTAITCCRVGTMYRPRGYEWGQTLWPCHYQIRVAYTLSS